MSKLDRISVHMAIYDLVTLVEIGATHDLVTNVQTESARVGSLTKSTNITTYRIIVD